MASASTYPPTIGACVKKWAETDPDTPAFIFVDPRWKRWVFSRVDVYRLAGRYASILKGLGIKKGDIISNTLPNSPERLITHIGAIFAGGVSVNGQVFLKDGDDFVCSLKNAVCKAVILDPKEPGSAASLLEKREKVVQEDGTILYPELPALKDVLEVCLNPGPHSKSLFDLLEEQNEIYMAESSADDMAVVWTTSGSTGFSKLVPFSHHKVLLFAELFSTFVSVGTGEILFNAAPFGWSCGSLTNYLTRGVTRVLPDLSCHKPDDLSAFMWDVICREKCVGAFLSPFYIERLVVNYVKIQQAENNNSAQGDDESEMSCWRLKVISSGGQPLNKSHLKAIGSITNNMHVAYGSTETGLMSWGLVDAVAFENCNNGFAPDSVKLKVVDEDGQELARGQLGEIMCKSPQAFQGYLGNDDSTHKTISKDGWISTGDIGYINEKGQVFVFCRKANSILYGVFVVHPGWLEARLIKYPGVVNVMIVPVPDPVVHQELCACLVTLPRAEVTAEGLKEFCKGLFLKDESDQMVPVPKYFLFFDALPATPTGKTCRRTTTALAVDRLGLKEWLKDIVQTQTEGLIKGLTSFKTQQQPDIQINTWTGHKLKSLARSTFCGKIATVLYETFSTRNATQLPCLNLNLSDKSKQASVHASNHLLFTKLCIHTEEVHWDIKIFSEHCIRLLISVKAIVRTPAFFYWVLVEGRCPMPWKVWFCSDILGNCTKIYLMMICNSELQNHNICFMCQIHHEETHTAW